MKVFWAAWAAMLGCVYLSDSRRSGFSALLWAKESVQEGTVDTKRLIGAIVAAFVILLVAG